LLKRICELFPKVLVIADNVHRRESVEVLFETFDYFDRINSGNNNNDNKIRFLFVAREEELDRAKGTLGHEKEGKVDTVLMRKRINILRVGFTLEDAILFVKQAFYITKKIKMSEERNTVQSYKHPNMMSQSDFEQHFNIQNQQLIHANKNKIKEKTASWARSFIGCHNADDYLYLYEKGGLYFFRHSK
jgi:hypothetical protein